MGLSRGCGSAGSVLCSQGTLGQEELSRCRARGDQGVDVPMLAPARSRCRQEPDSPLQSGGIWVADQRGEALSWVPQLEFGRSTT